MSKYLSIDTEATGLEEGTHLIQLALVPVDVEKRRVLQEFGREVLIKCPSFEELKPNLSPWVLEHNEGLIRSANEKGIEPASLALWMADYLENSDISEYFEDERPLFLGKSLSALDIPLLTRYLGYDFMQKRFHHHTVDVTCVARYLVDAGILPDGCQSTSKLIKHFGIREDAMHTALSDALDIGEVYLRLIELAPLNKT